MKPETASKYRPIGVAVLALLLPVENVASPSVEVMHLRGSVHLVTLKDPGRRMNIVVSAGEDGLLLVDTGLSDFSGDVGRTLRDLSQEKVRYIINTHYHGDHTEGNVAFGAEATIVAHRSTRENLVTGKPHGPGTPLPGRSVPTVLVNDDLTLQFNGETVDIIHLPEAHTDGDLIVHFREADVVCMGDVILAAWALPYALNPDSLAEGLVRATGVMSERTLVVPGHGDVTERSAVIALQEIVGATSRHVKDGATRGESLEEVLARPVPIDWKEWSSRFVSLDGWLGALHRHYAAAVPSAGVRRDPRLAVAGRSSHDVTLLDARTLELVSRIPTGRGPHEIVVAPDGKHLYAANYGMYPEPHEEPIGDEVPSWRREPGGSITKIDLERGSVRATFTLGECLQPHGLAVSRDGRRLWVTCETEQAVREINAATGATGRIWRTERERSHIVVAYGDDSALFVASIGDGTVTRIHRDSRIMVTIESGPGVEGLALSPGGKELWAANTRADTLSVIDTGTFTRTATVPSGGSFPVKLAFTPGGEEVWVANNRSASVAIIDREMRKVAGIIELRTAPLGILISPDGRQAFVTTPRRNEVLVINVASRRIVHAVRVGMEPDGMAWIP